MKKTLALLLCVILVLALVPVVAIPAAAADKVVYVKDGGTGDGSTADNAVGALKDAYTALGAEGGTIVIVGELTVTTDASGTAFIAPDHTGLVTITGKDHNGVMKVGKEHFLCGGDTTFDDLTIALTGATHVLRAKYNHLTFGENLVTKNYADEKFPQLYVVGGDNGSARNTAEAVVKDTHVTILGGKIQELIGGARGGAAAALTGENFVEIGKNADVQKLAFGNRSAKVDNGTGKLVLDGGVVHLWAGGHDNKANGFTGDVLVVITKNFDISKSFDGAGVRVTQDSSGDLNSIFNGISAASVFKSDKVEGSNYPVSTRKGNAKLLIANEVNAAVTATDKIYNDSFTEITAGDASSYEIGAAPASEPAPAAPAKVEVPARPTLTNTTDSYHIAFGSTNGSNPKDGEDFKAAMAALQNGGTVYVTGKAFCSLTHNPLQNINSKGTILVTAKEGDTSYIELYPDVVETAIKGHIMGNQGISDANNDKTDYLEVYTDAIFENVVIYNRADAKADSQKFAPGDPVIPFTILVKNGAKTVFADSVLFRTRTEKLPNGVLEIEEGAYAFLDVTGFSKYTGKGTIVVNNKLVDKVTKDDFAGFEGTVCDEDGNVLFASAPANPTPGTTPVTGSMTVVIAAGAILASLGAVVAFKKREER